MPRQPPLIACHTVCFGPHGGRSALECLETLGIRSLEAPIRTKGYQSRFNDVPLLTDESTEAELRALSTELAERRLAIACCPCPTGSLLNPVEVTRAEQKLRIAARIGAPLVTLDAGETASSDEYRRLVETLGRLGDFAHAQGLVACVELARGAARNHRFLLQLINDVDHRQIRASFDPGLLHLLNEEIQSEVALAKICHRVRHVRLRDSRGRAGIREFPVLGTGGLVNFLRLYQIMRDCGYRGPFSIALEGPPNETDQPLEEYCRRISTSLAYLRRIGSLDPY